MPRPSPHLVDPRLQQRVHLRDRVLAVTAGVAIAAAGAVPLALSLSR